MNKLTTTISRFQYEDMCSKGLNVLPISSVCNGSCLFCSNNMNPFPIYRCGFRPVQEVVEFLNSRQGLIKPDTEIRLSDALPGRISEGEATLHPKFFEICKIIRHRLSNTLHITTNGSMLTEEFIEKMAELKPFNVWLSYHSTNVDNWTKIFGLNEHQFDTATKAFQLLKEADIGVDAAIVSLPSLVGYDDIEKTMMFFNEHVSNVIYWKPGYSKLATEEQLAILNVNEDKFQEFTYGLYKKCTKLSIHWGTDPNSPLFINPLPILAETNEAGYDSILWLTADLGYERLTQLVKEASYLVPNNHYVQNVPNKTYGGNIACNGLLMVSDVKEAIADSGVTPDLIVAPSVMLDRLGRDLIGKTSIGIAKEIPVWWR